MKIDKLSNGKIKMMDFRELKFTDKRIEACERLGLFNSDDILTYYPYRFEEYVRSKYEDWKEGDIVTFESSLFSYPSTLDTAKEVQPNSKYYLKIMNY